MNHSTGKHWPLFWNLFLYWAIVVLLLVISVNRNDGNLIYPLDDTYIHMSIAKNAALYSVWGVTKYGFTSSTSSPLWTFLLTVTYFLFGINKFAPLLLNLLFSTVTLIISYFFLRKFILNNTIIFIILLIAVFAAPLPSLTLMGMEHILHILLTLIFIIFSLKKLSSAEKGFTRTDSLLMITASLLCISRYEGMFTVFILCLVFAVQRRILNSVLTGVAAIIPGVIYGFWSVSNGWFFFPNPVLLKGRIPDLTDPGIIKFIFFDGLGDIKNNPSILVLFITSIFLLAFYLLKFRKMTKETYIPAVIAGVILLHMLFASSGWFYRYEAYIIYLGILLLGISLNELFLDISVKKLYGKFLKIAAFFMLAFSFGIRTVSALSETPVAASNIYQQQYQMSMFLKKYYNNKSVALNDIGAATFFSDIKLVDLWGLGSLEPAIFKLKQQYKQPQIVYLSKKNDVEIAIVYDSWFPKNFRALPDEWILAGQWEIPDNVVCGDDKVSFYAAKKSAKGQLIKNMQLFSAQLHNKVNENGIYTSGKLPGKSINYHNR